MKRYFWNILISLDQMINALLFGNPDETLSSRMGKHVLKGDCAVCSFICWLLNLVDEKHCIKSIEPDE